MSQLNVFAWEAAAATGSSNGTIRRYTLRSVPMGWPGTATRRVT